MSVTANPTVVGDASIPAWFASHREERRIWAWSVAGALLLHGIALVVPLPRFSQGIDPEGPHHYIQVRRYLPPPPPLKTDVKPVTVMPRKRLLPVPDPTPDELEPIREPQVEFVESPQSMELDLLIGEPEPPPPPAEPTMISGVAGLTDPELLPETRVRPVYPPLARRAGLAGQVVLQALISSSGEVEDAEVIRCSLPGVGFEEAALAAVLQWRYRPGTYDGRPVGVLLTVNVNFVMVAP